MIKVHKGKFVKRDGKIRHMVFARIDDLPSTFVASKIVGAGQEQQYPDGNSFGTWKQIILGCSIGILLGMMCIHLNLTIAYLISII